VRRHLLHGMRSTPRVRHVLRKLCRVAAGFHRRPRGRTVRASLTPRNSHEHDV